MLKILHNMGLTLLNICKRNLRNFLVKLIEGLSKKWLILVNNAKYFQDIYLSQTMLICSCNIGFRAFERNILLNTLTMGKTYHAINGEICIKIRCFHHIFMIIFLKIFFRKPASHIVPLYYVCNYTKLEHFLEPLIKFAKKTRLVDSR